MRKNRKLLCEIFEVFIEQYVVAYHQNYVASGFSREGPQVEKDRRNSFHGNLLAPPIGLCLHGDVYRQVNEWDLRHIEEPAYEARQEGYAAARELLSLETSWTVDCILPILHNAIFTLNTVRNIILFVFTPCLFVCLFAYCRVARCHFVMLPLSLSLLFSHTSRQTVSFTFNISGTISPIV